MSDIDSITKLAAYYDSAFDDDGIFGRANWYQEGHKLALTAGRINYEARNENNPRKVAKLRRAAELALRAADILRDI
jgi:CxxC motif-containing protein (DUF1111 family)